MISRRKFISKSLALTAVAGIVPALNQCAPDQSIEGTLSGPNAALGHRLRVGDFKSPMEIIHHDVVIVGGGVSALSAARILSKAGVDYALLEMEKNVGGNASSGANKISAYPLGAHYLPVPGLNDPELIRFLKESKVITGYDNGKPIYSEYNLCFDPKERLYIHDHWQEGLVPREGVPAKDLQEIIRFHELIHHYRDLRGADGKEAFCIPLDFCSKDPSILALDKVTFAHFLQDLGFNSSYLKWYTNYCCSDDYGALAEHTSAWAGLHYFTSRKGIIANAPSDSVLTWPEGNGWLISQLKKYSTSRTLNESMVHSVFFKNRKVYVEFLDAPSGNSKTIIANKIILATPQFITQRLLNPTISRKVDYSSFTYAPWMVANLTHSGPLDDKRGEPLCWDNVIYGSAGLGYVNANHQQINLHQDKRVITYYFPMTGIDINQQRQITYKRTYNEWQQQILSDLSKPHPNLLSGLESMDIWTWGHGMIRPAPNFITGDSVALASKAIGNQIFFAHSDLSGISIFEEAFYRGTQAAKKILE